MIICQFYCLTSEFIQLELSRDKVEEKLGNTFSEIISDREDYFVISDSLTNRIIPKYSTKVIDKIL